MAGEKVKRLFCCCCNLGKLTLRPSIRQQHNVIIIIVSHFVLPSLPEKYVTAVKCNNALHLIVFVVFGWDGFHHSLQIT